MYEITFYLVNGIGVSLVFVLGHIAYRYYRAYKTYQRDFVSMRDEGRIVSFETKKSTIQDKPVVNY